MTLFSKAILTLIDKKSWLVFLIIVCIGLYLRFYLIEQNFEFGWDQARDSWVAREVLQGDFPLIGPRTGVGNFRIGPVYFYLLAPFYYFTGLDPMATNYFNILSNIINFLLIFYVTKKLSNNYTALFVIALYSLNKYIIGINQIPWNVTVMPGIAALILYGIYQIYEEKYQWFFVLALLCGFYFQLHFTAIFIPIIVMLSLIFIKNKIKALKYALLSLPLFLVWFVPNLVYESQHSSMNYYRMREFFETYYIGLHFRFMLHRMHDAFIMFDLVLNYPKTALLTFGIPLAFLVLTFYEKERKQKILGYIISLWFIIPLLCITVYGGPLSEYYFLYSLPMALYVIAYIQRKAIQGRFIYLLPLFAIFWTMYAYNNTKELWVKTNRGGLASQKEETRKLIERNANLKYEEGEIRNYLYTIWTEK